MRRQNVMLILVAVVMLFAFTAAAYAEDAQTLYVGGVKKIKSRDFEGAINDFGAAI